MDISMRLSSLLLGSVILFATACDYSSNYPSGPTVYPPPVTANFAEGLWITSGSPVELARLDATQLLTDGTLTPATRLSTSSASLFSLNAIAFDAQGVMWVASPDDSALLGFAAGSDGTSRSIEPSIVIKPVSGSIATPAGLAFDNDGSLWVSNLANGTIVRFDKSQLTKSGAP